MPLGTFGARLGGVVRPAVGALYDRATIGALDTHPISQVDNLAILPTVGLEPMWMGVAVAAI